MSIGKTVFINSYVCGIKENNERLLSEYPKIFKSAQQKAVLCDCCEGAGVLVLQPSNLLNRKKQVIAKVPKRILVCVVCQGMGIDREATAYQLEQENLKRKIEKDRPVYKPPSKEVAQQYLAG